MLVSEFGSSCYLFVICRSSFRAGEKFLRGRCLNLSYGSIMPTLGSPSLSLPHTGRSGFSFNKCETKKTTCLTSVCAEGVQKPSAASRNCWFQVDRFMEERRSEERRVGKE